MNTKALSGKAFFGMAVTIAMPIIIQNLISTLVNTADTVMLGYVSQTAMAASSLAGNITLIIWLAVSGLATGAAVLGSQYWGKKDLDTIERVLGMTVRVCCSIGLAAFLLCFLFPHAIMSLFTNEADVVTEGTKYLKIISFSLLFMSFSQGYFAVLRSIEKSLLPSVVYIASLMINVFLNATFIFGFFGVKKLGLEGVAIGTVAARAFECAVCVLHTLFSRDIRLKVKHIFERSGVLMKDFMHVSLPAFVNDIVWSVAVSVYAVILGHMGSDAVAANAVASMALNIGAIVSRGFGNGTTVIVGKALGEDDPDKAKLYGHRMLWITFAFSVVGAIVIVCIRGALIGIYSNKLSETALAYLNGMMLLQAFRILAEGVNITCVCGCFRGGGDARFGMIMDMLCMWLMCVPFMAAAAYLFKLPVLGVYAVMCCDEIEKTPIILHHYLKFGWLKNITRDKSELQA